MSKEHNTPDNSNPNFNNPNTPDPDDFLDIDDMPDAPSNHLNNHTPINMKEEAVSSSEKDLLAGKTPELETSEALLSAEHELETQEERPASQKPGLRTLIVLTIVGGGATFLIAIWSGFLAPKPPKQRVVATAPTPTATPVESNELASTKASLALQDQRRAVEATPPPIATKNPKTTAKVAQQPPVARRPVRNTPERRRNVETRVATRSPQPAPKARVITKIVPVAAKPQPQVAAKPVSRPPSPVAAKTENAIDRWAALANLGETETPETAQTQPNRSKNTADALNNPSVQTVAATSVGGNSGYSTIGHPQQSGASNQQPNQDAQIPTVTIGESSYASYSNSGEENPPAVESPQQSLPSETLVASSNPLITANSESDPAPATVTSDTPDKTENEPSPTSETEATVARLLTDGEAGILNQTTTSSDDGSTEHKQIPIGSSARGVLLTTMTWNSAGQDPTKARTAIKLTEDLLASDGTVAFQEGTTLIVQGEQQPGSSQLAGLSAIAIVYKDARGNTRQQQIPTGTITINGKNNSPLIAQNRGNSPIISKHDLLLGGLSGLGRVGEVINRPRSQTTINSSVLGSNQTTVSTTHNPNVIAAALDGLFNTTVNRAAQRADRVSQQPTQDPNINVIKEGTEVVAFVNAFVEVNR